MTCPYCATRSVMLNGTTCGNSFCQEAAYFAGLARTTRNRKKQKAYRKRESECCELARRWP